MRKTKDMRKVACSVLPTRWYQDSPLPDFEVSVDHAFNVETTIEITVVNDSSLPVPMGQTLRVPAGHTSVRVHEAFKFTQLTRDSRNHLRLCWCLGGVTVAEGQSEPFRIMTRRLKNIESQSDPCLSEPSLDTNLIDLPRLGPGYARRFALIGIYTLRDLASTSKTQTQLYSELFSLTEDQVIRQLIVQALEKHQVDNSVQIAKDIETKLLLPFQYHAQHTSHCNFSAAALGRLMQLASDLYQQDSTIDYDTSLTPDAPANKKRRLDPMSVSSLVLP